MKPVVLRAAGFVFASVAFAASAAQFKFGTQTLTVPDGFEIELIAASPLVDRPISVALDEQGRLFATDSAGTGGKASEHITTKPHRIVRLEDVDGDGRYDRGTVFADRMMFPEGAMWLDGSLYVSAPPEIWKLTDTNGDGVADKREVWHDGKTLGGCGNDLHGPYLGRDGWVYWCKGAWAEQRYTTPQGKPAVTRSSQIFRRRVDKPGQEPVLTGGMDNPVGVAFTSTGERFLSCTFFVYPAGGKRDGLIHAIYGGVYGKPHESVYEHKMTGDLMPVLVHMGAAAPCGLTCYTSRGLGDDYADNLFACYFNLHKIVRHVLVPDGATFKTKDMDFLSSDSPDFHPTDVLEDADGSLIVVDTGGWYKMCCPTSQLAKPDILGGIYRIRRTGAPKFEDARGLKLAWDTMKAADLVKLLGDERPLVRKRAIDQLGHEGKSAVAALTQTVLTGESVDARRNAVWALARIDSKGAREAVRTALNDRDAGVIQAALHVVSLGRDTNAVNRVQAFLSDANLQIARASAEALGRIGDARVVPALLAAVGRITNSSPAASGAPANDAQRVLEHSLIYALIEIGDSKSTALGLNSDKSEIRRASLVALDQMALGGLQAEQVTPLLTSADPVLKQTAAWIVSHRSEWGGVLADFFRERLANPPTAPAERAELEGQLAQLAKSSTIQLLLGTTLGNTQADARLIALRAMAGAGMKETPKLWLDEVADLLPKAGAEILPQAVATARVLPTPKGGHAQLTTALLEVGRKADAPAEVRLDALSVAGNLSTVEPALFDFLVANVAPSKSLLGRSAAANVLAKAKLTPDQQLALADTAKSVSPLELPRLLPAFERGANEALGMKLLASLKDSAGIRGLRVDLVKPLLAKYPKVVQDAGQDLLMQLNADAGKQAAHLEEVIKQLPPGDVRRGQVVFVSAKAACTSCHAQGHLGGHLGPDLTNIGKVRTERDLLEAIVYPSASFVRSFEPFTIATKSGDDFSGIIRKDAPDEVVLAIGPETEQHIARVDIAEMRPGTVSIMPQGLEDVLTKQELADLVAFLKGGTK